MRIGMILDQAFPPDIRVENEAVSLVNNGHDVFLFCFSYRDEEKSVKYQGIHLERVRVSRYWIKKMRALVNVIPVYEAFLKNKIKRFITRNDIDVMHVHDLYLLGVSLNVSRKLGIPIVSDLHENYVEGLKHYNFANKFPGSLLIDIDKWERTEKRWLDHVDKIVVVVEEAVNRLKRIGIEESKIVPVPNYLHFDKFDMNVVQQSIIESRPDTLIFSYIGAFDHHRGLHILIRAFAEFLATQKPAQLLLVGEGKISDQLKALAESLEIMPYVLFTGYQRGETIPSFIEASTVGIIPHLRTGHTNATLPHKLFQYMYKSKPVIVSNCDPLKRIVNEAGCGIVYKDQDISELASALLWCCENQRRLAKLGENGRKAVLKKYNWSFAEKNLLSVYENFEK